MPATLRRPHRSPRGAVRARCAAVLLAAVAAVSACSPQHGGAAGAEGAGASVVPAAVPPLDTDALLLDSWVSDGERGWFVDGAQSAANSPFSLYETAWRLRLAEQAKTPDVRVEASRLALWTAAAEEGRMASSGLPAVAQVALAVDARLTAGGEADRDRVARTLESLRGGGGYRTGPSTAAADPGSTAVALRVLTRLGLPVPAPVREANRGALAAMTAGDAAANPNAAAALLQSAGMLRGSAAVPPHTAELVTATHRALTALGADPVRLASEAALRGAADQLGVALPAFDPATCAGLVRPDGGVALPGAAHSDPQATSVALGLGCAGVRALAAGAHSRAGWPAEQAAEGALGASAAAVALANGTGSLARFAPGLERQIREVWLPAAAGRKAPYDTAALVERVDLRLIGKAVGVAAAGEVDRTLPAPSTDGVKPDDDARLLLSAIDLRGSTAAESLVCEAGSVYRTAAAKAAAAASAPGAGHSVVRGAWLRAAAQECGDPELARQAAAEAAAQRVGEGVYRAGKDASFEASVLGLWAERPTADAVAGWTRAGLCSGDRCAETPEALGKADHTPLRTLAVLRAARTGDFEALFPLSF
ncbi:hypothetical protein J7F03_12405 [Streptomyces sp. ISL-43]|uniref:hypothetical protein n=1 Tax=Streptomyces sp. ISL-43 TaxID=2819183 RepID=UPI001BE80F1D|nr:hypothetical protein [Streptomyces sp. ISL-43]MBT2447862.1 hypothetical protein [Streptomyces sp. ISL-43]